MYHDTNIHESVDVVDKIYFIFHLLNVPGTRISSHTWRLPDRKCVQCSRTTIANPRESTRRGWMVLTYRLWQIVGKAEPLIEICDGGGQIN
jgi:hypothetical protein